MLDAWVSIMTDRPNGSLYVGVTSDLVRRVWQHREVVERFTTQYDLHCLVYFERHETIADAVQREKNVRQRTRAWKAGLVMRGNPG